MLEECNILIPKVHNLIRLHALAEPFLLEEIDLSELDLLDNVYINSRYPVDIGMTGSGKPTLDESKELFGIAKSLYAQILKAIEKS